MKWQSFLDCHVKANPVLFKAFCSEKNVFRPDTIEKFVHCVSFINQKLKVWKIMKANSLNLKWEIECNWQFSRLTVKLKENLDFYASLISQNSINIISTIKSNFLSKKNNEKILKFNRYMDWLVLTMRNNLNILWKYEIVHWQWWHRHSLHT